jgi:hypothetical protein
MANDIRRLITQVTGLAKRAAEEANGVRTGTVISRNPDGSLNVDLGDGGCARVAPAANVNIGDKIVLGIEPSIGTTTNLPQSNNPINPPTDLCPVDPRIPPDTQNQLLPTSLISQKIASVGMQLWSDRDADQGNGTPLDCTTWYGSKQSAAVTTGNASVLANYRQEVVGACPQVVLYTVGRSWIAFDIVGSGVTNAGITGARIRLSLVTGSVSSIHDTDIMLLLGSASFPITVAQRNAFDRTIVLGSFRILGGWPTGPNSYGVEIELNLAPFIVTGGRLPDPFIVCLMTRFDHNGTTPPQVGPLVDNQDRQDVINFYVTAPNGPPVLEIDSRTPYL